MLSFSIGRGQQDEYVTPNEPEPLSEVTSTNNLPNIQQAKELVSGYYCRIFPTLHQALQLGMRSEGLTLWTETEHFLSLPQEIRPSTHMNER